MFFHIACFLTLSKTYQLNRFMILERTSLKKVSLLSGLLAPNLGGAKQHTTQQSIHVNRGQYLSRLKFQININRHLLILVNMNASFLQALTDIRHQNNVVHCLFEFELGTFLLTGALILFHNSYIDRVRLKHQT